MKKSGMLLLTCLLCAGIGFTQERENLRTALTNTVSYISQTVPRGRRVLILPAASPSAELGNYVADELSVRLVNNRLFTVVERSTDVMRELEREMGFQLSGEVSDETAQSLGRKSGAQSIISGKITSITGSLYRMSIKIINVEKGELEGQRVSELQTDEILSGLLKLNQQPSGGNSGTSTVALNTGAGKPFWIDQPLEYGKSKYGGISQWYYDIGVSNQAASEQRARTRAREQVQASVAANIASRIKARIDSTELARGLDSDVEDVERSIEAAFTNSIETKVPRYEALEWYVEHGKTDKGQIYYVAYILVRFVRNEIINVVDALDSEKVADSVIQQMKIPQGNLTGTAKLDFTNNIKEAQEYAKRELREENW
jgi:hypothetical protein